MKSFICDWAKIEAIPTRTGAKRQFFNLPTATLDQMTCHVTTLNPGEKAHEPHEHSEEEMIIVKEGTLEALYAGTTQTMGAGSIFVIAPNDFHGVSNAGDTPATYYVIKWFVPGMIG